MKKKYAFVDFCETLVDLQTADEFIEYLIRSKEGNYSYKLLVIKLLRHRVVNKVLKKIFLNYKSPKGLILKLVKGYNLRDFELIANKFNDLLLEKYLIKDVLDEIKDLKYREYTIIIVSGGYDIYIRKFFPDIFDCVVSTSISFNNGICNGYFDGVDCLEENKVKKLGKIIDIELIDYDLSYTYSDSITDLSLFNLSKNKVVISKIVPQEWACNEKFNEKIWFDKKTCK